MGHQHYQLKWILLFLLVFTVNCSKYIIYDTCILAILYVKKIKKGIQYHYLYEMLLEKGLVLKIIFFFDKS